MGSGEVCPGVEYLAFEDGAGSISRMGVVRRAVPRELGRYLLGEPIAAGGMAAVHLGRLVGPAGFSRTVAIKRMHRVLGDRPDLVTRFVDEARIASRVRHVNVVQTLDVVTVEDEVLLVLEYVHGESLARLRKWALRAGEAIPLPVVSSIVAGVLRGLHAAHEATSPRGEPLEIVHRDVSPQNVMVGVDGVARVVDFGIARASGDCREAETLVRDLKGKLAYMAPEQISGESVDRRCDLWATAVMLWETLAKARLFKGADAVATMDAIFRQPVPPLEGDARAFDPVLARALAKSADERFATAEEMARAVEAAVPPADVAEVAAWVKRVAKDALAEREALLAAFERDERSAPGSETRIVTDSGAPVFDDPTIARARDVKPAHVPTPMAMAAPVPHADEPIDRSATRLQPIEHLLARSARSTPIPIPAAVITPAPPPPVRRRSAGAIVALGFVPAAIVATLAIVAFRHHRGLAEVAPPPVMAAEVLPSPEPVVVAEPAASAAPPIPTVVASSRPVVPPRHLPRRAKPMKR